jgi:hypothetical protein
VAKFTYPQFTKDEVGNIVRESVPYNVGGLSLYRPPFYGKLAGKKMTLKYDNGRTLNYEFHDQHSLDWTENGKAHEEYYEALTADENVVLIVHTVKDTFPLQALITVLEMDTHLVTTFFCKIGNDVSTREVDRDIVFGYMDGSSSAPSSRHSLTTELVGRSIIWTYSPTFSIQHIYASKWYSCFVDYNTFYGGTLLSAPCNYVKINDHIYIYSWVETEGAGVQGFALMNLFEMHDVGCFFGINGSSRFECYTFGANGKNVGQLTNFDLPNDCKVDAPWPPVRLKKEGE